MDNNIARNVGRDGTDTLRVLGHNLYVRKCVQPDITDEDGKLLIELCEKTKDRTNWCEVLAIGSKVGQRREGSKKELHAKRLDRWSVVPIQVGDFVVLPACSGKNMMWRGGLGEESELIVDESEVIAMLQGEEQ